MAPSLPPSPSPARGVPAAGLPASRENDLAQSLRQLSLSSSSPARSPRARSPRPGTAVRSPLRGGPSPSNCAGSRSATPTLLRKASLNSLHSASGVPPQRRASSFSVMSPSARKRSPLRGVSPDSRDRAALTASSIATSHFIAELELLHRSGRSADTETVVILQDSCYGHRYSRPRTSRAALSTIVERPERIKASVLGVSAAYVRLGERHADGAHHPHPRLDPASIPSIPFRIRTTSRRLPLMSQTVTNVHGTKWMEELKIMCDAAEARLAMNGKELQRPEMSRFLDQETPQKFHEGDLYLCSESLDALEGALGGVCEAVDAVFADGGPKRAFVAIRPPGHHCSASHPSGFCWVNNVHVGVMHAILSHGLTHAAIIDIDLHHGDGSQSVAWQHNSRSVGSPKNAASWKKTSIGYFSIHDINSYPCEMGDEEKVKNASICIEDAHGQNIWNIHLQPWKSAAEFWSLYESKYSLLLGKARAYLRRQSDRLCSFGLSPKAAIFLSTGLDASEWESPGMQRHNVNVPTDFYARLTQDVVRMAAEESTGVEGRIISVLEGGYSDRALTSGTMSHLCGLAGDDPVALQAQDLSGLSFEMGQRTGAVRTPGDLPAGERASRPYDPSWWSSSELARLEALVAPPAESKKPHRSSPPTYSSPTQASSAKVVATPKLRRSVSGYGLNGGSTLTVSRPPSPPPPEVPWTVAAHELSKLLIPSDRPTDSCRHEDLSAEATRARRDRQAAISRSTSPTSLPAVFAAPAPTRMALRERKAKLSLPLTEEDDEKAGKNRRKTVGTSAVAAERATARPGTSASTRRQPGRPGRRVSDASTIVADSAKSMMPPPHDGASGMSRPTSALSARPGPSTSIRTPAPASLAVKKTRAARPAPKEAVAPGPRAQGPAEAPAVPSSGHANDSVDDLTGGMKKIKITLVTKEQREARERERAEKEKARSATGAAASVRAAGQPNAPRGPADAPGETVPTTGSQFTGPSHPVPHPHPHQVPLPASSPVIPGPAPPQDSHPQAPDVFIQYQPVGPAPETARQQQQQQQQQPPLQWLPPNSSTPTAARRADLPVFTSTSAIPFGARTEPAAEPAATPPPGAE